MNALTLALIMLLVLLAPTIALLLSARDMTNTAAHSDKTLAAVTHALTDPRLTPEERNARLAQALDDPAAPVHVAERAGQAAATGGSPYLFQPGRAARNVRAAVAGGLVIGAILLIPLTRRVLKLDAANVWVYVVLIAACLLGLPIASGLLAVYASRRALRGDAAGITVLRPLRTQRLPYAAVDQLTTATHLSGTSARRRRYTLRSVTGQALFHWDWPDPAPPVAQDALFALLVHVQHHTGRPLGVVKQPSSPNHVDCACHSHHGW